MRYGLVAYVGHNQSSDYGKQKMAHCREEVAALEKLECCIGKRGKRREAT